jgi:hypothetical protein
MTKVGRNEPCPCGSGKKFKHCCGDLNQSTKTGSTPLHILRAVDSYRANERIRQQQQGFGKPIIGAKFKDYQIVAVGSKLQWSKEYKTFPDFLNDYIKRTLGREWGNIELAKPLDQRHTLLQWFDAYGKYQSLSTKQSGEVKGAEVIGIVACYLGTAYNLYLLEHNVELQDRFLKRLRNQNQFQGAYYELIIANVLIRAGFELTLEDETDFRTKHCEFSAISKRSGKKYWVEAKARSVAGLLGKDASSGTTSTDPISNMIPQLNSALSKPAADDRLIFIDLNTDAALGDDGKPQWTKRCFARLEHFERHKLTVGLTAYLFITNVPHHRMLNDSLRTAVAAYGLGIPDFNRPGEYTLYELYRTKRRHSDILEIAEAFSEYPKLPSTFDGSLVSEAFEGSSGLKVGETYLFRGVQGLPGSEGKDLTATVTTAIALETEKMACFGVTDANGNSYILTEPMTNQQVADFKDHPDAYFGKVQPVGKKLESRYDLFEFFMNSLSSISRTDLLARLSPHPNFAQIRELPDEDLLAVYCDGLVAASPMFA